MTTIQARKLTLEDVHRLLNLVEQYEEVSFSQFFSLLPVSESEKTELLQIRNDFRPYLRERKAFLRQIKVLTLFPLLRLAGFYHYLMQIQVEEGIENIVIEDEDTIITGRLDIVLVNREKPTMNDIPFWILVIEAKESAIEVRQGLPQLLTYAYSSLERQPVVWGLVTNGLQYLFVRISQGNPSKYQLMPILDLMYTASASKLLQVFQSSFSTISIYMDEKIKELAAKYQIPEELLKEAMRLEKEKVNLENRRLVPKLIDLIERHTDSST